MKVFSGAVAVRLDGRVASDDAHVTAVTVIDTPLCDVLFP